MERLTLNRQQARRVILAHQGLWPSYEFEGKAGVLRYIRRVGCIQFDPLNIVGNNPELTLQSRISDFQPSMLRELLYQDRALVDGWDKMMSIYCTEDWPYFQRHRIAARQRLDKNSRPATEILPQVRQAIEKQGPLSSIDLKYDRTVDWSWAPTRIARAALESMYFWGELIIHHKIHTRKVYDFSIRHLPEALLSAPDPNQTEEQYYDWHVLRRVGSVGLLWNKSGGAWLGIRGLKSKQRTAALTRLLSQGKVNEIGVEGMNAPFYMKSEKLSKLEPLLNSNGQPPRAAILAPLDNLLWDRGLIKSLFDFDYCWEVYKPVAERRYGYYVLPVLYGDRFVARFEPGREKKTGAMMIKNWWWESGITPTEQMQADLHLCFHRFLNFLGAEVLKINRKTKKQVGLEWLTSVVPSRKENR